MSEYTSGHGIITYDTKAEFKHQLGQAFKEPCVDMGVHPDEPCFAAEETASALTENVVMERTTEQEARVIAVDDGLFFAADCFACHTKSRQLIEAKE